PHVATREAVFHLSTRRAWSESRAGSPDRPKADEVGAADVGGVAFDSQRTPPAPLARSHGCGLATAAPPPSPSTRSARRAKLAPESREREARIDVSPLGERSCQATRIVSPETATAGA